MPKIDVSRYKSPQPARKATPVQADGGLMAFMNRDISFGNKELSDKKKEAFYLELNSLLVAGINLKSSLELIVADQEKPKERTLFQTILSSVVSGATLSKALKQTGRFSTYETFSVQIGEETGKLNEILQEMARFYQNKIKQRRKIISALTYPCIVLCTSLGAVFFMLRFVVPMFGDIFKRFGGHLPWITEKIIVISGALQNGSWKIGLLLLILGAVAFYFRKHETFRRIATSVALKLPLVGNLIQKIYLARLCNSLRLLISARLPLLEAISLAQQMIRFYPLETSLKKVQQDIPSGSSLNESLRQFKIYPPKMVQLVKVGEETNQLDYFFGRISEQYVEEVEFKTSALSSMLEPLIIIFLGLVVGVILVSMYLPLFQMSSSFQ